MSRQLNCPVPLRAAQAVVIKPVSQWLGEVAAVRAGCCLSAVSFLGVAASKQLWQLLVCLMPLAVAGVTVATLNVARLTKVKAEPLCSTHIMQHDESLSLVVQKASPACLPDDGDWNWCNLPAFISSVPVSGNLSMDVKVSMHCFAADCVIAAVLLQAVPTTQAGTVMALDMSMGSGLRTVSPLLGTWMLQRYGYPVVATCCATMLVAVVLQQLLFGQQALGPGASKDGKHQYAKSH